MKFDFKIPDDITAWSILLACISYILNLVIKILSFLVYNRGSSRETRESIDELKKDMRDGFDMLRRELKGLVTKEELNHFKKEIQSDINLRFIKIENDLKTEVALAKREAEHQTAKAQGMKQQLRAIFTPVLEKIALHPENKASKKIAEEAKEILDEYGEK